MQITVRSRAKLTAQVLFWCVASLLSPCLAADPQQPAVQPLPEEAERKSLEDRIPAWKARLASFQARAEALQSQTAKDLALGQAAEIQVQLEELRKKSAKLLEIIEVKRLIPDLSGKTLETARETLARLELEMAGLRAGVSPGAVSFPAPSPPPTTNPSDTSNQRPPESKPAMLAGRLLDENGQHGVPYAAVLLRCEGEVKAELATKTDANGNYSFSNLPPGNCLIRAGKDLSPEDWDATRKDLKMNKTPDPAKLAFGERTLKGIKLTAGQPTLASDIRLEPRKASIGEFARAIVGFEQSGASAAPSAQKFFFDLWLSVPAPFLPRKYPDPNFGPGLRLWGDIRVTSTAQQIQSSIGDFAVRFAQQVSSLKVNDVAQASEFLAGAELRIVHWGVSRSRLLSFDPSTRERFGMYLVAGGGTITPINPRDTPQIFAVPPAGSVPAFDTEVKKLGLNLTGKEFIAFAAQDRDKFFRQYYGGIRLKTFYYDRDTGEPLRRFPATLDVLVGQSEAITGGRLRGPVLRLEGFYPFPFSETRDLYLFGTAELNPGRPHISDAVILAPAPTGTPVPAANVLLVSTPQLTRDHYRIGVGIDFLSLIQHIKESNANNPNK